MWFFTILLLLPAIVILVPYGLEVRGVFSEGEDRLTVRLRIGFLPLPLLTLSLREFARHLLPSARTVRRAKVLPGRRSFFESLLAVVADRLGKRLMALMVRLGRHVTGIGRHVVPYLKVERYYLKVAVGTGDAATTAVLVGALWVLLSQSFAAVRRFTAGFKDRPRVLVSPVYGKASLSGEVHCIICFRLSHIISASVSRKAGGTNA